MPTAACSPARRPALSRVENLTWKNSEGAVQVNPLTFIPADLTTWTFYLQFCHQGRLQVREHAQDGPVPGVAGVPNHHAAQLPWLSPECAVCGGSASAYAQVVERSAPGIPLTGEAARRRPGDPRLLEGADLHGARPADGRPGTGQAVLRAAPPREPAERASSSSSSSRLSDEIFEMMASSTAAFSL